MNIKSLKYRTRRFCAFIIGAVFLLAGMFKLLDPVGAGLVMEEYFRFLHVTFMMPAAKALAVALAVFECILGAALVTGVWRKPVAVITTVVIGLFSILTFVMAVTKSEMDCGCFGEVIHLTSWQTYFKNLILLALALAAFVPYRNLGSNKRRKFVSFSIVTVSVVAFAVYSLTTLPMWDFTSFAPGSELLSAGSPSQSDASDSDDFVATFIYEKDGQEGAFSLDRLPDSTWTFVRTETVRRNLPSDDAGIALLSFSDSSGTYCDELAAKGNVLVLSVHDVEGLKGDDWTRISGTVEDASGAGFTPLLLVSCTKEAFDSLSVLLPEVRSAIVPSLYFSDRKTLITLNRSNGGATWFNDGQLIRKFHFKSLPSDEDLVKMTGDDPTETMLKNKTEGRLHYQGFLLYLFAVLLLL